MMLSEAQARLKTQITEDQFLGLGPLYTLLDLDKDDFCKIVDAVGIEKILEKQARYKWLERAADELLAKERYLHAKRRLMDLAIEMQELKEAVDQYEKRPHNQPA